MKKKVLSILVALVMLIGLLPATALAEETPDIWVGGVGMFSGDYLASGATETTSTKPEDNYAYYFDGVLTLCNYSYEGEGVYDADGESCYDGIHRNGDLEIVLTGENSIKLTAEEDGYGITVKGELIVAEDSGGGSLDISGVSDDGIYSVDLVVITGGEITINAGFDGIYADDGGVIITGGQLNISAVRYGIYGHDDEGEDPCDILVLGGRVTVSAVEYALYAGASGVVVAGGRVDLISTDTEADDEYYAVNYGPQFVFIEGLVAMAATEPDGSFEEYEAEKHATYDHIKIGPSVWVGGVRMIDGDYLAVGAADTTDTMPATGGYAYYNDDVLTLHNYSYEGDGYEYDPEYDEYALVYSTLDLDIVLEGENVLTAPEETYAYGIYVPDLFLSEGADKGSVAITVSEDAVWAEGYLTVKSGTIKANCGDDGLYADYDLFIKGGSLEIAVEDIGIYSDEGEISIKDGDIVIEADVGVCADYGRVTISGGQLDITAGETGIYGYEVNGEDLVDILVEGGIVKVSSGEYGLCADKSSVVVNGGYVDVKSTNTEDDDSYWAVYYTENFDVAEKLIFRAAEEPDGEFGEYVVTEHKTYDHIRIEPQTYTIKYTDGVEGVEIFADQEYSAYEGFATPAFEGTPARPGYTFDGWDPEVSEIVTGDATYTAKWTWVGSGVVIPSTYYISINAAVNGSVTASSTYAEEGTVITLTVTPKEGYLLDKLTVMHGSTSLPVSLKDGKYLFTMPAGSVTVTATFKSVSDSVTDCPKNNSCPMSAFSDLAINSWYHDGVHYCVENGLMQGVGGTLFAPNSSTSRAMIVTILWRLERSPVVSHAISYEDVAVGMWYTEAIRWANSVGIMEGYSSTAFGPNDAITREQLVTTMWRYAKYKGYDVSVGAETNILSYGDAESVSAWAVPAVQWACGAGLLQGIAEGGTIMLKPQGGATRAQVATILYRFYDNIIK